MTMKLKLNTPKPTMRGSISRITRQSVGSRQPSSGYQRARKRIKPGT